MEKKIYITDEEREKCGRVKEAFSELYEMENILVMDAGRFGFIVLKYYRPPEGFEDVLTFTDSRSMFDELWEEWLNTKLFLLAKGTPMNGIGYSDIFKSLSEEKQKELTDRRKDFLQMTGIEEE